VEEIESNLGSIVKFVNGRENEYNKEVVLLGIRSLFESEKISY